MKLKITNIKIIEKLFDILLDILIFIFGIILLISLYIGIQTKVFQNDYANFFGYSLFEVQTGSMAPTINAGDWIVVKITKDIKLDDVITYKLKDDFITHKVVEMYNNNYITMGEANNAKDKPVNSEQVVGKVVRTMRGFGIFRRTLFNPAVLIAVIITLFIASTLFKKNNGITTKSKIELYAAKVITFVIEKAKKVLQERKLGDKSNKVLIPEKIETKPINLVKEDINKTEDTMINNNIDNNIKTNELVEETPINKEENIKTPIEEAPDSVIEKNELVEDDVYREPDIEKTAIYRYVMVDQNEYNDIKQVEDITSEESLNKEDQKENVNEENQEVAKELSVTEEAKDNSIEEINSELDEESKTKLELEELNERCGKKSKNIIEKVINIKKEEIKELIAILENGEREGVNETTIKNEFINVFVNVRFYNNYIQTGNSNKRFDTKAENTIRQFGNFLANEYGGTDTKYNEKVSKYINIFIAIADLEQTWNSKTDYKKKYQFYRKTLINYYKDEKLSEKNIRYLINSILKLRKKYVNIVDYLLKKIESNTFALKTNKLTNMKNTYGVELIHNISFNKIYSEYVIDKTYSLGIIAEDKIAVLITLLLGKITRDMLESDFDNKYILYFPNSLYDKERKFERLLKMIDNDYTKNHIKILVTIKDFLDNRTLIKSFIKDGYKFSIVYDKEIKILYEEFGNLYIVDEIFIDKNAIDTKKLFAFIPEEIYSKFVDEDILNKVDNFGSV